MTKAPFFDWLSISNPSIPFQLQKLLLRRGTIEEMESNGEVKHILLAKFKEEISEEQIQTLISQYANLVNLVPSMKAFKWGKDVSIENLHQGFTHIFESTFESTEGIAEYISHPDHVDYANTLLSQLEKVLVVDYKPTKVQL